MITSFLAEVNFKWVCPESHRQKTWKPKNIKTRCTQVGIWRISRFHQYRNGHKHLLVSSPECSKYQVLWSRLHEEREKLKLVSIYKPPLLYCYCMHYHHYVKWVQIRSFFSSVFSGIRTKYGEIRSISPYSVRMQENTDQKKLRIWPRFKQCMIYHKKHFEAKCQFLLDA